MMRKIVDQKVELVALGHIRNQGVQQIKPFLNPQRTSQFRLALIHLIHQKKEDAFAVRPAFLLMQIGIMTGIIKNRSVVGKRPAAVVIVPEYKGVAVCVLHDTSRCQSNVGDHVLDLDSLPETFF